MATIKYTTDGKKVAVIGKLNAEQTIVQEIFIIDSNEVPSGENFVVTSLHDAPAVSWEEKEIKEWKARYEKEIPEYKDKIKRAYKEYSLAQKELSQKITYMRKFIDKAALESFDTVVKLLTSDIKYWVYSDYGLAVKEAHEHSFLDSYGELKMLSLYGRDDGSMTWRINKYSDGSGRGEKIIPASSTEELKEILHEILHDKERRLTSDCLAIAKRYDVKIDTKLLKEYYENQREKITDRIRAREKVIKEKQNDIKRYQEELKEIGKIWPN